MKFLKNQENHRWLDKTALITGASSGIGATIARELASHGLSVILVARRLDRLKEVASQIIQTGGKAQILAADLSTAQGREVLIRQLNRFSIRVDVLVNNAGFGWYGYYADMPWVTADDMLQVNVAAVMHLTRLLLPPMLARRSGWVINIGSIAGGFPNQGVAVYSAAKAFMDAFTTSLYRELRGSGVSISVVRLGPVRTEFFQTARSRPAGGSIPGERFAISVENAARSVWSLLLRPRRYIYVPAYMWLSRLFAITFSGLVDQLGPLLLRRRNA